MLEKKVDVTYEGAVVGSTVISAEGARYRAHTTTNLAPDGSILRVMLGEKLINGGILVDSPTGGMYASRMLAPTEAKECGDFGIIAAASGAVPPPTREIKQEIKPPESDAESEIWEPCAPPYDFLPEWLRADFEKADGAPISGIYVRRKAGRVTRAACPMSPEAPFPFACALRLVTPEVIDGAPYGAVNIDAL